MSKEHLAQGKWWCIQLGKHAVQQVQTPPRLHTQQQQPRGPCCTLHNSLGQLSSNIAPLVGNDCTPGSWQGLHICLNAAGWDAGKGALQL